MHLHHSQDLDSPVELVWPHLTDLVRIGRCFPGAEVTEVDGADFVGHVTVRLGPVTMTFDGTGSMTEVDDDAHRAVIAATGSERHGLGTADITITARLEPRRGGRASRIVLDTELEVRRAPTPLGSGVGQRVSDPLIEEFLVCIGDPRPTDEVGSSGPLSATRIIGSLLRRRR